MYAKTAKGYRDEIAADYGSKAKSRRYLRRQTKQGFRRELRNGQFA